MEGFIDLLKQNYSIKYTIQINWWKFSTDGSYQLMEVFNWWKLSTYSLTDWLTYSLTLITSRAAHNAKKSAPVGKNTI